MRKFLNAPNLFAGAVSLLVFVFLFYHLIDQWRFIRSDDALIEAHFTTLSAQVQGVISSVYIEEHNRVQKGQILARIDARDYRSRLNQSTQTHEASNVKLQSAIQDLKRAQLLFQKNDLSAQSLDQAKTKYEQALWESRANEAHAETAKINESYTNVRAPEDGIIALRTISPGTEVKEGDPLFGIVYPKEKWVEAKIKETDLKDLHLGESVQVEIDAIPGRGFQGTLQSISPTTEGLEAALIPDNSAGNFTKYVQRVPIKVALELSSADQELVRAGLSARIRIRRKI